ncbi:ATP-dependent Clp protease ATP-binding subunit, partial [bacterium]|nr:ATP-dependent Clp protease ATP-binding subunit [bacterium]
DEQVAAIFSRLDVSGNKLIEMIKNQIMKYDQGHEKCRFSRTLKEVLVESYIGAHNLGQKKISAKNLIIPCLEKNSDLREVLYDLEIDKQKVFNVLLWFIINEKQVENYRIYRKKAGFKPGTNMDRAYTSVATPLLNQLGYDLTIAAKWGKLEYCVARENEIEKIFQIFESGISGVILAGQVGVGKKTIIDGVAQLMVKEDVPDILKDKRLVELDLARLISGVTPAQAQGRMVAVIDEIARAGNIVLYMDNIESIIGISSGAEESLDLSGVLASALKRKELYCLATATSQNYVKYIEGKTLGTVMSKIDVIEPLGNQAIQIIESKIGQLEGKYKVYFSYNAIEQVIELSSKYIHDRYLPEKAIYILELVAVKVNKKKGDQAVVGREDIAEVLSDLTNIPITKISQTESQQLLNLEDKIHERMINQEVAVKMVADSLRRARAELREGKRPIANFLFLGPTGVGKTELAKTVAEIYFGEETHMIRLDMSEYQHPDSIKKMIGDAQGAVGYLTESVRKTPFSLVLLDELEKADANILNVFLQVMDDGRLTDGQGRTIDFTNSIIIATSNAGALYIQEEIFKGTDIEKIKNELINEYLNKVMRPELINRFDGVIVFEPLSMENVVEIAKLMLKKIETVLLAKGINFNASEEGTRLLAKEGYDPKFGARPLRRIIQDKIENSIANKILANELERRDTVIIDSQANVIIEKGRKL